MPTWFFLLDLTVSTFFFCWSASL